MTKLKYIEFQGQKYLLVGDAIATIEAFQNGQIGYAHVGEDGFIRRYGGIIGTKDDIEILGEVDIEMTVEGIANLLDLGMTIIDNLAEKDDDRH